MIRRVLLALGVAAIVTLPVVAALLGRVPNTRDVAIVSAEFEWPREPVKMGNSYLDGGVRQASVSLWQTIPDLARHDEIRLLVVTYGTSPALDRGELRIRGTTCTFTTRPGSVLLNNSYLSFVRGPGCQASRPGAGPIRLDLTITFRGRGQLGLETFSVPPTAAAGTWISFTDPDAADGRSLAVVRARYVDVLPGSPPRRLDMLGYVWHLDQGPVGLWIVLGVACAVVWTGALLLLSAAPPDSRAGGLERALGTGLLGLGVALFYSVLVPPLQAPDEPDHLLAFADTVHRPDLVAGTAELAKIGHFNRIRFNVDERFGPADVDRPLMVPWGAEVLPHKVEGRSPITWSWWRFASRFVRTLDVSAALFTLRIMNALLFAVALFVASIVVWALARDAVPVPSVFVLALLLVPTLPFLAMHVSEFALLVSAYVMFAVLVAAIALDGRQGHWLGLPFGLTIATIYAGGRSGLPLLGVLAAILAGRALLATPSTRSAALSRGRALVFWGGLGLGLLLIPFLSTPTFLAGLWPEDTPRQIPTFFREGAEALRKHPGWVLLIVPCGFAAEVAAGWLRRRVCPCRQGSRIVARTVGYGGATAVGLCVVGSLLFPYPHLPTLEAARNLSAPEYVGQVVLVALTGLRVASHDLLTSSSFWAGFGWIDTLPGDGFVTLLVVTHALALVTLCVRMARVGHGRRAVWLVVIAAGWVTSLALYGASSYYLKRNLLGRYVAGLYLLPIAISWASVAGLAWRRAHAVSWVGALSREWILAAGVACVHAWALVFILTRYF